MDLLVNWDKKLFSLTRYVSIAMALSCLTAIFQFYNSDFFWNLRYSFGLPDSLVLQEQFFSNIKVPGLAYYGVQLGYQISVFFPLALYALNEELFSKKVSMLICSIFILASLCLQSITSLLTTFISLTIFTWLKYDIKKLLKVFIIIVTVFFSLNLSRHFSRLENVTQDASALSRVGLAAMAIDIIYKNPFGNNEEEVLRKKAQFILRNGLPKYFQTIPFHNSFLNTAVRNGVFIASIYIAISIYFLIKLYKIWILYYRAKKKINLSFFLFLSWLSYCLQSLVHNAGLPSGDIFGWLLLGIIVSLTDKNTPQIEK